ncbi:spermidine/putrescine ABC transporter permease PotC [Ferrimonas aestuarii]|uniref:Spermidine/putrescine transport system permease protein PotC n=1 Tax=Ferrimonas aestuarii TaxID=2569539 RepID=A0A4U1BVP6_9GAMM|nr:spermidine/putrescine ABC transporter permease PotC [Ferrimonas aestuarii]TKB57269.1 spermidine/putrescine ABC transporter permease PotC [Ferrimonas aestuarii]
MSKFLKNFSKWGFLALLFAYLYMPIAVLVANSFNAHKYGIKWTGFTTKWYDVLVNNSGLMQAAGHSLTIAILSATLATAIGTLAAVALFRYRFRGKPALNGMLFVVMTSPDIVMAVSLLALFVTIGISLGFWSLLIAHITFCLPFVVVTVYARLKGFDNAILEAARDLGASEWRIFNTIILPLAAPAIFAGWLLSFTLSLDDVIISSFVTGPAYEILPLKIYSMVKVGVSPEVNALATIMLILSLSLVALAQFILKRKAA